mmetsp:Transcript_49657/g.103295  ORF Transcript_49657/g.103295 Transcript_49657/m.103295 type:complete len:433 (+) Transcript_49657:194-1492(+)
MHLVHPLREVRAALQGSIHLSRAHGLVLAQILRVLPLEELDAILGDGLAAKVAVGGSVLVLRLTQSQGLCNGSRSAIKLDLKHTGDVIHGQVALLAAISLHKQGQRLSHTDGIRQLHQAARAQAAVDHGLGHLTADVGSRSVHLGRILARESTAAVGSPASVGVNDDLPAGEACVALRTTDDELAGGVDVQVCVAAIEADGRLAVLQLDLLKSSLDDLLLDLLVHLLHSWSRHLGTLVASALLCALGLGGLRMLRRDDHGVDLLGLNGAIRMLQVLDGHLSLAVRAEPPALATLADLRQRLAQARGHGMGQGHAVRGLIAGIAEHDTLIAGADIHVVLAHMHTPSDVGALLVDADQDLAGLVAQALAVHAGQVIDEAVEANLLHDASHNLVVVQSCARGDLSGDHHHVVLGGGLAGHLALGVHLQAGVEDGI